MPPSPSNNKHNTHTLNRAHTHLLFIIACCIFLLPSFHIPVHISYFSHFWKNSLLIHTQRIYIVIYTLHTGHTFPHIQSHPCPSLPHPLAQASINGNPVPFSKPAGRASLAHIPQREKGGRRERKGEEHWVTPKGEWVCEKGE